MKKINDEYCGIFLEHCTLGPNTISSVTKSGYNEHTFVRKHLIDINVKKVRIERIALVTGNFLPPANEVVGR